MKSRTYFFLGGVCAMMIATADSVFAVPTIVPFLGILGIFAFKLFFFALSGFFLILAALKKSPGIYITLGVVTLVIGVGLYFFLR